MGSAVGKRGMDMVISCGGEISALHLRRAMCFAIAPLPAVVRIRDRYMTECAFLRSLPLSQTLPCL